MHQDTHLRVPEIVVPKDCNAHRTHLKDVHELDRFAIGRVHARALSKQ